MIAALKIELHIPSANSLKDKRQALRPLIETARARYHVAVAEVDYQDLHRRAVLEVAAVASAAHVVESVLDSVERLAWSSPQAEVVEITRWWLETE